MIENQRLPNSRINIFGLILFNFVPLFLYRAMDEESEEVEN